MSGHDAQPERSEFLRGPKWRTRTTPRRRARAALITFAIIVAIGSALLIAVTWLLSRLGAPTWVALLPWVVPTAGALLWAVIRPAPAVPSDDDDESWPGYAIQFVMIGDMEPREAPTRLLAAVLFGAPVVWALAIFGFSTLIGLL